MIECFFPQKEKSDQKNMQVIASLNNAVSDDIKVIGRSVGHIKCDTQQCGLLVWCVLSSPPISYRNSRDPPIREERSQG